MSSTFCFQNWETVKNRVRNNTLKRPMHGVSRDELRGKLAQLQHLRQHTHIKAALLEKEDFKGN